MELSRSWPLRADAVKAFRRRGVGIRQTERRAVASRGRPGRQPGREIRAALECVNPVRQAVELHAPDRVGLSQADLAQRWRRYDKRDVVQDAMREDRAVVLGTVRLNRVAIAGDSEGIDA